jgi:cytoskeleton protein RodZ
MADSTTEPQTDGPSAGALLRAAREKQGLHIAALAAAIKVAPRKLEALESDRWDELPDATFTRALALTVCRTLKIDPAAVLARLPSAGTPGLLPAGGLLNEPFREHHVRAGAGIAGGAVRPLFWAAGLFVVASALVYFLPARWWPSGSPPPVAGSASAPGSVVDAVASAASEALSDVAPAAAGSAPSAAGETVFAAPAPTASDPAQAAAGLVQLSSTEPSWVVVRDARGQVLFSRTVQPGESVGLDGSLPLRLTIGNAAATQLAFRGQPVDLASRAKENVARVELQ